MPALHGAINGVVSGDVLVVEVLAVERAGVVKTLEVPTRSENKLFKFADRKIFLACDAEQRNDGYEKGREK